MCPSADIPSGRGPQESVNPSPIPLLEGTRQDAKTWEILAPCYGVTNLDPPWKTSLYATCECLAVSGALDPVERRHAEDQLAETTYRNVPQPERQLLTLAHTMLRRGLLQEDDLKDRMDVVRARLHVA
jgi:nitrile hydratase beta subunit-like protein